MDIVIIAVIVAVVIAVVVEAVLKIIPTLLKEKEGGLRHYHSDHTFP